MEPTCGLCKHGKNSHHVTLGFCFALQENRQTCQCARFVSNRALTKRMKYGKDDGVSDLGRDHVELKDSEARIDETEHHGQ